MSVNRERPHVFVLPEDDANRQLAKSFLLYESVSARNMQVLPEAGGWQRVLSCFEADHIREMIRYPKRFMVLLVDFDGAPDRLERAKESIPEHLADRVFVLGVWSEPEALRSALGAYETIGLAMARDCREGTDTIWSHELLRHNAGELDRLRTSVWPILFGAA